MIINHKNPWLAIRFYSGVPEYGGASFPTQAEAIAWAKEQVGDYAQSSTYHILQWEGDVNIAFTPSFP